MKTVYKDNFTLGIILNEEYTDKLLAITEELDIEAHDIITSWIDDFYDSEFEDEQ